MATPGREAVIRNHPSWLETRFRLFEEFCLPSVAAQTSQHFNWIIYFDRDTPQVFKDRIKALQAKTQFEAYFTGLFPASGWPDSLQTVLGPLPAVILTSRLDNDDALAVDYMQRTWEVACAQLPTLTRACDTKADPSAGRTGIVLTNGFIRADNRAYRLAHPSNAFVSWLERTDDPARLMTAMGIAHMDAAASGRLVQVSGPGSWLQLVHGGNVSNKVRGQRVGPVALAGRFHAGALNGLQPANVLQLSMENSFLVPIRKVRDILIRLTKLVHRRLRG